MKCNEVQEKLLDLMQQGKPEAEVSAHLSGCGECAGLWKSLRSTSELLDEWRAPEISPYWETRFRARLDELKRSGAAEGQGFLGRLKIFAGRRAKPVLAGALALVLAAGVGVMTVEYNADQQQQAATTLQKPPRGTGVDDLQKLDKDQEMYAGFDLLDDMVGADHGADQQPVDPNSL